MDENAVTDGAPRDMYYKDVPLFKVQGTVDRVCSFEYGVSLLHPHPRQLVDDLAVTLDLERADLKIVISLPSCQRCIFWNVVVACCVKGPPIRHWTHNPSSRRRNDLYQRLRGKYVF
jgi:hypothetical protein